MRHHQIRAASARGNLFPCPSLVVTFVLGSRPGVSLPGHASTLPFRSGPDLSARLYHHITLPSQVSYFFWSPPPLSFGAPAAPTRNGWAGEEEIPLDHWLAFVAAAAILLAIPGPTVLLVVSYSLGHGRKAAGAMVAGVVVGDFIAMTASMLGVGLLLEASALLYTGLRWIGAGYLIYLGIKLWRAPVASLASDAPLERTRPLRIFFHTCLVTALNPKGLVFFVAFVPQFLDTARPFLPQVAILEATFIAQAALNSLSYALLASAARRTIRKPAVQRAVNLTGGSLLIGAGVLAAALRRT